MWDILQYTPGEWAFNFSQGSAKVTRVEVQIGAGIRVWASKTALNIRCKSYLEYLETTEMESFTLKGPTSYSEISDLGGGKESGRTTEGGVIESYNRKTVLAGITVASY